MEKENRNYRDYGDYIKLYVGIILGPCRGLCRDSGKENGHHWDYGDCVGAI